MCRVDNRQCNDQVVCFRFCCSQPNLLESTRRQVFAGLHSHQLSHLFVRLRNRKSFCVQSSNACFLHEYVNKCNRITACNSFIDCLFTGTFTFLTCTRGRNFIGTIHNFSTNLELPRFDECNQNGCLIRLKRALLFKKFFEIRVAHA